MEIFRMNHIKQDDREKRTCSPNMKLLTMVNLEHFFPGEDSNVTVNIFIPRKKILGANRYV